MIQILEKIEVGKNRNTLVKSLSAVGILVVILNEIDVMRIPMKVVWKIEILKKVIEILKVEVQRNQSVFCMLVVVSLEVEVVNILNEIDVMKVLRVMVLKMMIQREVDEVEVEEIAGMGLKNILYNAWMKLM